MSEENPRPITLEDVRKMAREEAEEEIMGYISPKEKSYAKQLEHVSKRKAGTYQKYQGICNRRINPNDPESWKNIEFLEGGDLHPNDAMARCANLWRKDRDKAKPIDALKKRIDDKKERIMRKKNE